MNIYIPIIPTYLYIKQHSITGLKYFGKTSQKDPIKYLGSGTRWRNHIKKHGKQFIKTIWLSEPYIDTSITEVALLISEHWDIVNSNEWANIRVEDGLSGGDTFSGKKHSIETIMLMKEKARLRPLPPEETRNKISKSKTGVPLLKSRGKIRTEEHKSNLSTSLKGKTPWNAGKKYHNKPYKKISCPHCDKECIPTNAKRWHFDNCKSIPK